MTRRELLRELDKVRGERDTARAEILCLKQEISRLKMHLHYAELAIIGEYSRAGAPRSYL